MSKQWLASELRQLEASLKECSEPEVIEALRQLQLDQNERSLSLAMRVHDFCPTLGKAMLEKHGSQLQLRSQQLIEARLQGKIGVESIDEFNAAIKLMPVVCDISSYSSCSSLLSSSMQDSETSTESSVLAATALIRLMLRHESNDISEKIEQMIKRDSRDLDKTHFICEGVLNSGSEDLILDLLPQVLDNLKCACKSREGSQSFRALRLATLRMRELAGNSKFDDKVRAESAKKVLEDRSLMQSILEIANENFDNSLKGLGEVVTDIVANTLEVLNKTLCEEEFQVFVQSYLDELVKRRGFGCRATFASINCVLQHFELSEVLQNHPEVQNGLFECLSSNHLVSSGSVAYRTILRSNSSEIWQKIFLQPLMKSLLSENNIIQSNAKKHFLPPTLQLVKKADELILEELDKFDVDEALIMDTKLCLIKCQRQQGRLEVLEPSHLEIIASGISHGDREVRMNSFSILCQLKNRSVPPTSEEMSLIIKFINCNITVDSTSFRRQVVSDVNTLLVRIRDFLARKARKNVAQLQIDPVCSALINDLDKFLKVLFDNLFPSANYQRLITSLSLLELISELFFVVFEANKGFNKRSGNGDPSLIIKYCNENNIFQFSSQKHIYSLLSCAVSFMDDVRFLSNKLLRQMIRPKSTIINAVLEHCVKMLCAPSVAECEAAANLIVTLNFWDKKGLEIRLKQLLEEQLCPFLPNRPTENERNSVINEENTEKGKSGDIKALLLDWYSRLMSSSETNLLNLARHCPMHGLLTTLRLLLNDEEEEKFLEEIIKVLKKSTSLMLSYLSGSETSEESSASFETMGKAIEAIIEKQSVNTDATNSINISEDQQLILALCWLNLKESCLLASKTATLSTSNTAILECGHLLMDVLVRCRHKGVIEATQICLLNWSQYVQSKNDTKPLMPEVLGQVLSEVSTYKSCLTRRSAGIPMIVQSLLACENNEKRPLLKSTLEQLIKIAKNDFDLVENGAESLQDTPKQHALHILRALIHHSILGQYLKCHESFVQAIIEVCLESFSSPIWSERNASLQLFGALVPRLLGQRKNSEDDIGVMSVDKFVDRFNSLLSSIVHKLKDNRSNSTPIIPLLSMLSQFASDPSHNPNNKSLIGELRKALFSCLTNRQWRIRQLAAKSFAKTVAKDELDEETKSIANFINQNKEEFKEYKIVTKSENCDRNPSNFTNGCLLILKELASRLGSDRLRPHIKELILPKEKYLSWCVANQVLLKNLTDFCDLSEEFEHKIDLNQIYQPFYRDFMLLFKNEFANQAESLSDSNSDMIDSQIFLISLQKCLNKGHIKDKLEFMEKHVDSCHLSLTMADEFVDSLIDVDKERAVRIVNLVKVMCNRFGEELETKAIIIFSKCISIMVEEDINHEFSLNNLDEFVAMVEKLSSFANTETQRLSAAKSLLNLDNFAKIVDSNPKIEPFLARLFNVSLALLYDEDEEVRLTTQNFICKTVKKSQNLHEKLIIFALEKFSSNESRVMMDAVQSMLIKPTKQLHFHHTTTIYEDIRRKAENNLESLWSRFSALLSRRRRLFEAGDGINVFIEPINIIDLNTKALHKYLSSEESTEEKTLKMKILNVSQVKELLKQVEELLINISGTENDNFSNIELFINTNCDKAYVMLRHIQATVSLLSRHYRKIVVSVKEEENEENLEEMCATLSDQLAQVLMLRDTNMKND